VRLFVALVLWLVVFALLPIAAIAALVLLPIIWLISLPIRLAHLVVEALFQLVEGILFLPARMLGVRRAT
jgi:hypothetical protein